MASLLSKVYVTVKEHRVSNRLDFCRLAVDAALANMEIL